VRGRLNCTGGTYYEMDKEIGFPMNGSLEAEKCWKSSVWKYLRSQQTRGRGNDFHKKAEKKSTVLGIEGERARTSGAICRQKSQFSFHG